MRCGTVLVEPGHYCPACGAGSDPALHAASADDAPAPPAGAAASLLGRAIGDFVIEAVIGGGSFGTVYRGRQLGLDRPVAIKVPTYVIAADPVQARRFAREARAAARIVHPGVVAIYAVGELDDGRPYLVMQLIDGVPLDQILDGDDGGDRPVPPLRALRIVRDIASALSETHAAGVVHRDLKPSNIMWRRDRNGDDRVTLVDFGIAVCRPGHADASRLTTDGLIGTPHYMSPEQAQGEHVDGRTDLYALGCILFELVTATPPFDGSGFEVLLAHLGRPAPCASERNPAVPAVVDQLIAQLLRKKPDDRPASADAAVALIDDAIAAVAAPRASRSRPRTRPGTSDRSRPGSGTRSRPLPRARSRRWPAAGLAMLALSGVGFAALRLGGSGDDEAEPSVTGSGASISASGEALRMIAHDDGELIVRTLIPEMVRAGAPVHAHLEITNKLGGRFSASQVVITVEDPHHNATAQTAAAHGDRPGHYAFVHTFPEPGHYIVRIFPSETETVSTIDLDVAP
jgi:serine/threonine-protein kinase